MAIPSSITRDHVLAGMHRLIEKGLPPQSESTKYDVVAPGGILLPPKVVLSVAAEIATGAPLPRSEFSGGEETNARLQALGFEIREKPGRRAPSISWDDIKPGVVLSNDDLMRLFEVGISGGMRWSSARSCLVLVTDPTKSLYDDRWEGETLHYTGMGKRGDQQLTGQNRRLSEQATSGVEVHLFEVFTEGQYVYAGRMRLAGPPKEEQQRDEAGALRRVYVFPLELLPGGLVPTPSTEQLRAIQKTRASALRDKSLAELRARALTGGRENPGTRIATAIVYTRDPDVAEYVKKAAGGICDLCRQRAPFSSKDGPYLECHHVIPLAKGGPDVIQNAVALCPNCHRKMHVLNLQADKQALARRVQDR